MPRGVLVGCLAPSGLSATRSSPSPLSSTSIEKAFFYPSLGNSAEMVNSTFPCPIGTFFTQTHSPESRAPGRRPCEEAVGRPLGHLPLDVYRDAFCGFSLHRWVKEDKQKFGATIEAPVPRNGLRKSRAEERRCPPWSQLVFGVSGRFRFNPEARFLKKKIGKRGL